LTIQYIYLLRLRTPTSLRYMDTYFQIQTSVHTQDIFFIFLPPITRSERESLFSNSDASLPAPFIQPSVRT